MFVVVVNVIVVNVVVMLNVITTLVTLALFIDICFHVKSCNLFFTNGCAIGCNQDKMNNLITLSKLKQVRFKIVTKILTELWNIKCFYFK